MKRLYVLTFLLGIALIPLASQGTFAEETTPPAQSGPAFVDEDGNGICDNYENGGRGLARGRGVGRGRGIGRGRGTGGYFVDADGDGVCDNFTNGTWRGVGRGRGTGGYFVDADGDGVCDNYGTRRGMRGNYGRNRAKFGTPSENAPPNN